MPTSPSTRLGLIAPADVGDAIKTFPDVMQAFIATLDPKAVVFDAGARMSRPVSTPGTPGVSGRVWRSTDDGGIDWDHGTGWVTITPGLFAALPTIQLDTGREIWVQTSAMATALQGPWRMRYDGAKWAVAGGQAMYAEIQAPEATTASTFADLTAGTVGPGLDIPLVGDYDVEIGMQAQTSSGTNVAGQMSYSIGGATALAANAASGGSLATATAPMSFSCARRQIGLPAVKLTAKYLSGASGSTMTFSKRWMRVTPVRIG